MGKETNFDGIVYKKKVYSDKITLYIKSKEKLIVNYYTKDSQDILLGDKINVIGELIKPSKNTIPNIVNYQAYLYNNEIFYIVKAKTVQKISNNTNIVYYLREKINNRINNISKASGYIKIFILGDSSTIDDQTLSSYRENGISHLFSISGMHISLFASLLMYILKKISYSNFYRYFFVITFLICYALLVGNTPSVIRSLIMYLLFAINKTFNLKIKSINIMCQTLIIILSINPYYIYNISFQYSYLISFFLVLYSYKLKNKKYLLKSLNISLISFLVSFPICIYNFYQVNFLSIILNIFLIPFVSFIIFPLSIVCFIFPSVCQLLDFFVNVLENISLFISSNNFGIIIFSKPSMVLISVYYIFIILFLYNHKYFYILIIMFVHKISIYFNQSFVLTMLDVGQGDSSLIRYPHNQGNILIDTGGLINSNYSLTDNKTIPYLHSLGLNKIEYLILTHGDFDHMGEAINLVKNFKIENVILNCGSYNKLEQDLIKKLNNKNIEYYSCIESLNIGKEKVYFLNTQDYNDENNNSTIIYTEINNTKMLLMGDAGIKKEQDTIKKYNLTEIDILKVGHHGSNTSSSIKFIESIKPKNCLISVGKNNKYGHPNDSVLNVLDDYCNIYRTDLKGSVEIKINNNYVINTYNP